MKAQWYTVVEMENGSFLESMVEVKPDNGKKFTYEELQGFVQGKGSKTIQIVYLPDGRQLVANENGKLVGLPYNSNASEVWREQFPIEKYPHNNDGVLVGDILITPAEFMDDEDGEESES